MGLKGFVSGFIQGLLKHLFGPGIVLGFKKRLAKMSMIFRILRLSFDQPLPDPCRFFRSSLVQVNLSQPRIKLHPVGIIPNRQVQFLHRFRNQPQLFQNI